jgi:glutathione S-transferase
VGIIRRALGWLLFAIERPLELLRLRRPRLRLDGLVLYHYPACPFCIRVRCAMLRYGVRVELRNIDSDSDSRALLVEQGGKQQVPCLRIEQQDGSRWLYESAAIIAYLKLRLAQESVA